MKSAKSKPEKKPTKQPVAPGASLIRLGERWIKIGEASLNLSDRTPSSDPNWIMGSTMIAMGREAIAEGESTSK